MTRTLTYKANFCNEMFEIATNTAYLIILLNRFLTSPSSVRNAVCLHLFQVHPVGGLVHSGLGHFILSSIGSRPDYNNVR